MVFAKRLLVLIFDWDVRQVAVYDYDLCGWRNLCQLLGPLGELK
jgi:hypothetical protein